MCVKAPVKWKCCHQHAHPNYTLIYGEKGKEPKKPTEQILANIKLRTHLLEKPGQVKLAVMFSVLQMEAVR